MLAFRDIVREWSRNGFVATWQSRSPVVMHLASEMADLTEDGRWMYRRPAMGSGMGRGREFPLVWVRSRMTDAALKELEDASNAYGVRALLADARLVAGRRGWRMYCPPEQRDDPEDSFTASLWCYSTPGVGYAFDSVDTGACTRRLALDWLDANAR